MVPLLQQATGASVSELLVANLPLENHCCALAVTGCGVSRVRHRAVSAGAVFHQLTLVILPQASSCLPPKLQSSVVEHRLWLKGWWVGQGTPGNGCGCQLLLLSGKVLEEVVQKVWALCVGGWQRRSCRQEVTAGPLCSVEQPSKVPKAVITKEKAIWLPPFNRSLSARLSPYPTRNHPVFLGTHLAFLNDSARPHLEITWGLR